MSHVDDGMLHGYLDGALSALDAVRVERHVADCAACQQRLEAARGLIQRAARLLEWASPPADRAAPALAELRPYSAPRWRVPVAWAATIVLALGAGVYGGQLVLRNRQTAVEEKLASRSGEDRGMGRASTIIVTESVPAREEAAPAATPAQVVPPVTAPANLGAADVAIVKETTSAQNTMADAAAKARVDTAAALAALGRRAEAPVAQVAPKAIAPTPVPAPTTAQPPVAKAESAASLDERVTVTGAMAPRAAQATAGSGVASSAVISADSARALLGTAPVALPGYPVNSMRLSAPGVVTVEQVVPPGRVIRVIQRRAAANEEQERAASSDLLARYVDGLRVEITGPMPAESLSVLLGKVKAVP